MGWLLITFPYFLLREKNQNNHNKVQITDLTGIHWRFYPHQSFPQRSTTKLQKQWLA